MVKEADPLRGVDNFYGPRTRIEGQQGEVLTAGAIKQMVLEFTGDNHTTFTGILPASAKVLRAIVNTDVVAVVTGTTPALEIGTDTSEVTNGFTITEAQLEALGTVEITTFNGTWALELQAQTTVGLALSGTSPTFDGGEYRVIIEYVLIEA